MGKPKTVRLALADKAASNASCVSAGPEPVILTIDELRELGLPEHYVVKVCLLCGNHSASSTPFPGHSDCQAWQGLLPWSQGTRLQPRGEICRVCYFVFGNAGFIFLYTKIRDFVKHLKQHPEDSTEFLTARETYIQRKLEQPSLQLKGTQELWPERIVNLHKQKSSSISKPKQFLMQLDKYTAKFGEPSPDMITSRTFGGKEVKGVLVTREQDDGMWELAETEMQSVQASQQLSHMYLANNRLVF